MNKEDFMHLLAFIAIVGSLMAVGAISVKYLGPDNAVEEEVEDLIEEQVEIELKLPPNSLKSEFDLLDGRKHDNSASG